MLVKLVHFLIIEPQRSIGGLIFFIGGGVDYDIEHCHCFNYFLPNLQLNIGKKYLKSAKIIDESLILQLFYVTILLSQVISFNSSVS